MIIYRTVVIDDSDALLLSEDGAVWRQLQFRGLERFEPWQPPLLNLHGDPAHEFPWIGSHSFAVSDRARRLLEADFSAYGVFLPLEVPNADDSYWVFDPPVVDALAAESEVVRFSDPPYEVRKIVRPVIDVRSLGGMHVFRTRGLRVPQVYFTETAVRRIEAVGLPTRNFVAIGETNGGL